MCCPIRSAFWSLVSPLSYYPSILSNNVPADGTERQAIKDLDGTAPRPRIKFCSICDPFVMIIREDESLGLFIGEAERGKIRRKDMSPMGEKVEIR